MYVRGKASVSTGALLPPRNEPPVVQRGEIVWKALSRKYIDFTQLNLKIF